jgi:hypothetical protein
MDAAMDAGFRRFRASMTKHGRNSVFSALVTMDAELPGRGIHAPRANALAPK